MRFRRDLLDQIGQQRSRGVIIDVAALDVIDSFACHTLRTITEVARLRGAETVVVGIQPDVALAMVRLGVSVEALATALDLEEGMARLEVITSGAVFLPGKERPVTGDAVARLRQSYSVGFLRYLSRRDELTLHTAYELGRRGLATGVSLLDLVQIHHAVLVDALDPRAQVTCGTSPTRRPRSWPRSSRRSR